MHPSEILRGRILIVDDQQPNILLLERMLRGAGFISVTSTMDPVAVGAMHRRQAFDLVLLDLQMPARDGFQVMKDLQLGDPDESVPVLVITAQPGHRLRALQAGARDFLSKPLDLAEVLARVRNLLEVRLLYTELHGANERLERRVRERTRDLEASYLETIHTLVRAAEHRDPDTGAHVQRIGEYSRACARLLGETDAFVEGIFFASPMHDIGKIGVPDDIMLKPGALTPAEWDVMKSHTVMGAQILGRSRSPYLVLGAEIALHHHERWDGGGYPGGKAGDAIPLSARIVSLCDVYDALRSERPYKPALDHAAALRVIAQGDSRTQPSHFDPAIHAVFTRNHAVFRGIFES